MSSKVREIPLVTGRHHRWLTWVDEAEILPEQERVALSSRDLFIRRAVAERDPDNKIAVGLFGEELTNKLVRALWGGVDEPSLGNIRRQ